MAKFLRISDAENPVAVLQAPMEAGLVPTATFWPGGWDGNFDDSVDSATNDEPDNSGDVEDELYERFLCALGILSAGLVPDAASCDANLCSEHPMQRSIVIRALVDLYPGLRI